jgi:hypothetical protein
VEQIRGRLAEDDPLAFVHKMIDLPYELVREEPEFWKLQARLSEVDFARKQHARFLQPLPALLQQALQRLGYAQPEQEAQLLMLLVEALWKTQVASTEETSPTLPAFIKTKYAAQR